MQAGVVPRMHSAPQELQSLLRRSGQQYYADARLVSQHGQHMPETCTSSNTPYWHAVLLHVACVLQRRCAPCLQVMYKESSGGKFGGRKACSQEAGSGSAKKHTFYLELLSGRERSTAYRSALCT
jgi:hypothetical protein